MQRKGTNFTNLGKYLSANKNTGLAEKVGEGLSTQAQGLSTQLNEAKDRFRTDASDSLVDPNKLAGIVDRADKGTASDQDVAFYRDASKGAYKGPQNLDEQTVSTLRTGAQNLSQAANSPASILSTLFNNRQTAGGLNLDRAVLQSQGGSQPLQQARLASAQTARSVRGAENEARNTVNELSRVQKSRADQSLQDLAARRAAVEAKARGTTKAEQDRVTASVLPVVDLRGSEQVGARTPMGTQPTPTQDWQAPATEAPTGTGGLEAYSNDQLEKMLNLPTGTFDRYDRASLLQQIEAARNQQALTGTTEERARLSALSQLSGETPAFNPQLFNQVDLSKANKVAIPGSSDIDRSIALERYDIMNNPNLSEMEKMQQIQALPVKYGRATTRVAYGVNL